MSLVATTQSIPSKRAADGQADNGVLSLDRQESGVLAGGRPQAVVRGLLSDLIQLTKPRIVLMVLVTAAVAVVVAAGSRVSAVAMFQMLLGTALVGASAGAMNQIWERTIDLRMRRTRNRPLPAGRISLPVAAIYCAGLGLLGTAMLYVWNGFLPAFFGAITWVTYVLIYTPMKTRTAWNTTIGAISGALPMMIGFTAAGGSITDPVGWLLVSVLVAWQYPHFMAIAWIYRREYGTAGFQMTPVVEPSGRSAGAQAVAGSIAVVIFSTAVIGLTAGGWFALTCCVGMLVITQGLLRSSLVFATDRSDNHARRMLRASLIQLPLVMLVFMIAGLLS